MIKRHMEHNGQYRANLSGSSLMKMNHLFLQRNTGRPARIHLGTFRLKLSNQRWGRDFFEIACWNGDLNRVPFSMHCCDREIISYMATTGGIVGDTVRGPMAESIEPHLAMVEQPANRVQWLRDDDPAYIARETANFEQTMGLDSARSHFNVPNRMEF